MVALGSVRMVRRSLPRHGRGKPGHPDAVERHAFRIGITGTRPVMTKQGAIRPDPEGRQSIDWQFLT